MKTKQHILHQFLHVRAPFLPKWVLMEFGLIKIRVELDGQYGAGVEMSNLHTERELPRARESTLSKRRSSEKNEKTPLGKGGSALKKGPMFFFLLFSEDL